MASRYPFSAGQSVARTRVGAQACDCHLHVYDARFPAVAGAVLRPPDASLDQAVAAAGGATPAPAKEPGKS